MHKTISIEMDNRGVATIWLDRADKRNALSAQMITELHAAADAISRDASVRVAILAAKGGTFCAGGDLEWMRTQFESDAEATRREASKLANMLSALNNLPKPLIGRLHGNAFGGGVGLACVCDVAVGVDNMLMAFTETRLGLIPATISPYVRARMGASMARRVFMSGRGFAANEAVRLNILSHAVSAGDLDDAVEKEVAPYLKCAPQAVAKAKKLLLSSGPKIEQSEINHSIDELVACWEGEEAKEGISAFFSKQKPAWDSD
ncbi:MAG: crotonase/enoyl-CoA hydratase family protein [Roseovarius sp.]|nr:crotonase/enoyl-CoA hydratase family protein [Roseovarius sp.]